MEALSKQIHVNDQPTRCSQLNLNSHSPQHPDIALIINPNRNR